MLLISLHFDDDLLNKLLRQVDARSVWFNALPVSVQLKKLAPWIERQAARDAARFNITQQVAA